MLNAKKGWLFPVVVIFLLITTKVTTDNFDKTTKISIGYGLVQFNILWKS